MTTIFGNDTLDPTAEQVIRTGQTIVVVQNDAQVQQSSRYAVNNAIAEDNLLLTFMKQVVLLTVQELNLMLLYLFTDQNLEKNCRNGWFTRS